MDTLHENVSDYFRNRSETGFVTQRKINLWNPNSILFEVITKEGWEWCLDVFRKKDLNKDIGNEDDYASMFTDESLDPLPHKEQLLINKGRTAAWIVCCLLAETLISKDLWNWLVESEPTFLNEVWEVLFASYGEDFRGTPICQWVEKDKMNEESVDFFEFLNEKKEPKRSYLIVLTPDGWETFDDEITIKRYLPDPGSDWRLEII